MSKSNGYVKPLSVPGVPLTDEAIAGIAKRRGVSLNMICCMCGDLITMQIFKNTGVCCELHRKDRDGDHEPFGGGALTP